MKKPQNLLIKSHNLSTRIDYTHHRNEAAIFGSFCFVWKEKKMWLIWILLNIQNTSWAIDQDRLLICIFAFISCGLCCGNLWSINSPMVTMTTSTRKAIKIDIHIYIETLRQIVNSQLKKKTKCRDYSVKQMSSLNKVSQPWPRLNEYWLSILIYLSVPRVYNSNRFKINIYL